MIIMLDIIVTWPVFSFLSVLFHHDDHVQLDMLIKLMTFSNESPWFYLFFFKFVTNNHG